MRPHVFCLEHALLMIEEFEHHIKLGNQILQSEKVPRLDSRQQTFDVLPSDVLRALKCRPTELHFMKEIVKIICW